MRKKIEQYALSWDTLLALVAIISAYIFIPENISNVFCYTVYNTGITVLSIIFSIFFASLTVIMAFPDNQFITFIEKPEKIFSRLLSYFRGTLFALFIALLFTIVIYMISLHIGNNGSGNKWLLVIFCGVFTYSLVATMISVDVTLKMTSSRAKYLCNLHENEDEDDDDKES